jgi:hypothetical protein
MVLGSFSITLTTHIEVEVAKNVRPLVAGDVARLLQRSSMGGRLKKPCQAGLHGGLPGPQGRGHPGPRGQLGVFVSG